MSKVAQNDPRPNMATCHTDGTASHRRRSIRVLFMHHDTAVVNDCLHELKNAQFVVSAAIVLTLEQCTEQIRSQSYDVVVAGYPSSSWKGTEALELLRQAFQETPLLFVTTGLGSESLAELTSRAAFHYVEREHVRQLPLAVRQILNEQKLRHELEGARKALRHSQSLYRALVDNPAYGIYRCNAEGKIVDVNQALVAMLGYRTKEEFFAESHLTDLLSFLDTASFRVECSREALQIEPVETQWKRKNGAMLKARISGRAVFDDYGNFAGHEIIAVDITEQRTLEDQLRHQASTDSLTGLGNHRRLVEALHAEICRSKRTGREFSLALLDLDGLKGINDSFRTRPVTAHSVGSDRA